MRIIEVRHYHKGYVVFVNATTDITTLRKRHGEFTIHASYSDPTGKSSGKEYFFNYAGSLAQAKAHIRRILGRLNEEKRIL